MNTITLPDELNLDSSLPISVYNYESVNEISKQQVLLNQNTFSFLQAGTKEVYFDNSSYAIDNSEFLLMKSGHCLMTEILSNESRNYRSILFFFTTNEILNFIKKFDFEFEKSSLKTHHSTFAFKYDSFIKSFTQSLFNISMLSNTFQEKILKTKFDEIMLYLIDMNGLDFLYSLINNSDNQNQKFIQIIESNSLNKLTIKELSFLSNMSVSTFKREFFKNFRVHLVNGFKIKDLNILLTY